MTAWSRYLFGVSIIFGVGTMMLAEKLPEWWGPVSVLVMVLAASAFLTCSILEYRRGRSEAGTLEQRLSP
ncbi:hypothetical protein QNO08_10895 [Arthrobacter sp. zg-Y820]|uniref:hypothetical protein n=1 Tax=unclassified Arthrobacter TaxID=235627 RepID=UPI001E56F28D|nr:MULTISPECIES: hypothetical protein [unclassified Arthrobacter]MCC9196371.1 hypothetical protein [Arthrobacter sp. zg-Y820]MDK1279232.1 hypothetical protein [Arthrobacter sp. zg.Y820]MDK1359151.1 hypothetical protein [Arthrobacter sp. zg-Y1219]WIB08370.1 hypothetical protein QNO08_10895 [Arthrobacter sp. zg-Y820]